MISNQFSIGTHGTAYRYITATVGFLAQFKPIYERFPNGPVKANLNGDFPEHQINPFFS